MLLAESGNPSGACPAGIFSKTLFYVGFEKIEVDILWGDVFDALEELQSTLRRL